jgi:hypothetical protein
MIFPHVTGTKLLEMVFMTVTGAPANKPAGIRNMFATECSKPIMTKAEMGGRYQCIFPSYLWLEQRRKLLRQTNQLQNIALTTVGPNSIPVFATAIPDAIVAAPPVRTPQYEHATAKPAQPIKFPAYATNQLRSTSRRVTFPSNQAADIVAVLPVKS